jgi:TonB family protein
MKIKTLPGALAWSLGAHGIAMVVLVLANATSMTPRQAIESVPFIRASLIYAMNGQSTRKTPSPPPRKKDVRIHAVRPVHGPAEQHPRVDETKDKTVPEAVVARDTGDHQAKDMGADASVSLHLPVPGSDGARQVASLGAASENHLRNGQPGGSAKVEAGPMVPPRYLTASRPAYPILARMRGYEGMVLLAVEVTTDGRTGEVRVKQSSGYALLDRSALNAVRTWRFEPARKMNTPLAMTVDIPVRFSLKEAD